METYKIYKQKLEEYFEKHRIGIGFVMIFFVLFSGTTLMMQGAYAQKQNDKITNESIQQQNTQVNKQEAIEEEKIGEIVFDIEGAVVSPGVYRLPEGSVLVDAINKAGGFSVEADHERIARELNQASVIGNNAKLYIFRNKDRNVQMVTVNQGNLNSSSITGAEKNITAKININSATIQELDSLPKIGPVIAQRIIDWRDANGGFEVIEDLKKVKGIGDSLFDGVKDQIVVE